MICEVATILFMLKLSAGSWASELTYSTLPKPSPALPLRPPRQPSPAEQNTSHEGEKIRLLITRCSPYK